MSIYAYSMYYLWYLKYFLTSVQLDKKMNIQGDAKNKPLENYYEFVLSECITQKIQSV